MEQARFEEVARMLLAARGNGPIADLPEHARPRSIPEAYAIQERFVRGLGAIGGWKVLPAKNGDPFRCTPVPAVQIHASPARIDGLAPFAPQAEVEVALRFGRSLAPRPEPYTHEEVCDAIASLHLSFEIVASRFVDRKALPPLTALADLQSNAAIVLGEGRSDWAPMKTETISFTATAGGQDIRTSKPSPSTEDFVDLAALLVNDVAKRNMSVEAGHLVITGARIGPFPVDPGMRVEAKADGFNAISVTFG